MLLNRVTDLKIVLISLRDGFLMSVEVLKVTFRGLMSPYHTRHVYVIRSSGLVSEIPAT